MKKMNRAILLIGFAFFHSFSFAQDDAYSLPGDLEVEGNVSFTGELLPSKNLFGNITSGNFQTSGSGSSDEQTFDIQGPYDICFFSGIHAYQTSTKHDVNAWCHIYPNSETAGAWRMKSKSGHKATTTCYYTCLNLNPSSDERGSAKNGKQDQ